MSAGARAGSITRLSTADSARTPRPSWTASTNGTASAHAGMPGYLLGADYVKTFNDDKINREVEIRLTLARPAILYVLLDKRSPVPDWLRARFFNTGDEIGLDGGKYSRFGERKYIAAGAGKSIDDVFTIWRLDVPSRRYCHASAPFSPAARPIICSGSLPCRWKVAAGAMILPVQPLTRRSIRRRSRRDHTVSCQPTERSSGLMISIFSVSIGTAVWPRLPVRRVATRRWIRCLACLIQTNHSSAMQEPRYKRDHVAVKVNLPAGTYYAAVTGSEEVGEVGWYHVEVKRSSHSVPAPNPTAPSLVLRAHAQRKRY